MLPPNVYSTPPSLRLRRRHTPLAVCFTSCSSILGAPYPACRHPLYPTSRHPRTRRYLQLRNLSPGPTIDRSIATTSRSALLLRLPGLYTHTRRCWRVESLDFNVAGKGRTIGGAMLGRCDEIRSRTSGVPPRLTSCGMAKT